MLHRYRFTAACALFAASVVAVLLLAPEPQRGDAASRTARAAPAAPDSSALDGSVRATNSQRAFPKGISPAGGLSERSAVLSSSGLPAARGPTATFFVTTRPVGARVLIDGNLAGVTPLIEPLPAGEYQLSVRKKGYVARDTTIVHSSSRRSRLVLALREPVPFPQRGPVRREMPLFKIAPAETSTKRHARLRRYLREAKAHHPQRSHAKDSSAQAEAPPKRVEAVRGTVEGW